MQHQSARESDCVGIVVTQKLLSVAKGRDSFFVSARKQIHTTASTLACRCFSAVGTNRRAVPPRQGKNYQPPSSQSVRSVLHSVPEGGMFRSKLYHRKRSPRSSLSPRLIKPCPLSDEISRQTREGLSLEEFTREVARALDTLPQEIVEKLTNVTVTIEDCPSAEVLAEQGVVNPNDLFGLYRGVPRPWRSVFAPLVEFPDKIEIYYLPILHSGLRPREMRELIRRVVVHEVGHHFGMSDQQLRALGY